MSRERPWRELAGRSNDELVDLANETLSDRCLQKQIEFEMWRRDANLSQAAAVSASLGSDLAMAFAILATSVVVVQFLGRNSLGALILQGGVFLFGPLLLVTIGVRLWRRTRYRRRRHWPGR